MKQSGYENGNGSGNCCRLGVFGEIWVVESGFWRGMATFCVSAVLGMEIESRMMSMIFCGGDLGCSARLCHHGRGSCLRVYLGMVTCLLSGFGDVVGLRADVGGEESAKVTQTRVVCLMQARVTSFCYPPFSGRLLVEHMSPCLWVGGAIAQVSETVGALLDCCLHRAQNHGPHAHGASCRCAFHTRPFHVHLVHGFG